MPPPDDTDGRAEGAVLRSMVLLSTLSTAAEVWHAAQERRAGRDPSAQETSRVVMPRVRGARTELQEMLMRQRASAVYAQHQEEDPTAHLVRRFDDLMTLQRVARLLHLAHQWLLSLYPDVTEALVEEVRHLEAACAALAEGEAETFVERLEPFIERTLVLSVRLREEVG
jgi:hypothetical protein